MAYDEYAIGGAEHPDIAARQPRSGWLDSLDSWGVICRGGRLYRAVPGSPVTLERTAPACYYDRHGGVSCAIASPTGLTTR